MRTVNTAAAVRVACSSERRISVRVSRPRRTPIKNAPPAPMPPASVGVNRPPYRPPMTKKNSSRVAQISRSPVSRSRQSLRGPAGRYLGRARTMTATVVMYMEAARMPGTMPGKNRRAAAGPGEEAVAGGARGGGQHGPKRPAGGDHAGGERLRIAVATHLRIGDGEKRRCGRDRGAGDCCKTAAGRDGRNAEP